MHTLVLLLKKFVLLIDNAACHGRIDDSPESSNVKVVYLPKRTTSRIQPLDASIIAVWRDGVEEMKY